MNIYKFSFTTPLHISNEREDYSSGSSIVHSDTIYAAIFWAWNMLGKSEWIPKSSEEDFGFTISSCFPFLNDIYFLPRPLYSPQIKRNQLADTVTRKSIKKVEWIDSQILKDILSDVEPICIGKDNFNGKFWSAQSLGENFCISSNVTPRVMVPRNNDDNTRIFYIERFYFQNGAGLYLIAKFKNDDVKSRFESALRLLADEGIGTDRNIGNGKFTFTENNMFPLNITPTHNLLYGLGLFCPNDKKELNQLLENELAGYELKRRGGWLSEPYLTWRKRQVYMFKEGSVFSSMNINNEFIEKGKNVDLKPNEVQPKIEHPIWRCGKTLFIPF